MKLLFVLRFILWEMRGWSSVRYCGISLALCVYGAHILCWCWWWSHSLYQEKKITSNVSKQNAARESKELWEMYGEFFGDNPSSCLWISYLKKSKRKSMRCWLCLFWKGEFFSPLNVILSLLVNLCLAFPKKKFTILFVSSG